ncbi:uncharacterized protein LOC142974873 [Anticarsia gemmatalis]|uniref:uncharacterized protein LOC142974873 n=1 Tax=Anticarsia gemmatalis TaxID=129554 RepID=UPI003F76DF35
MDYLCIVLLLQVYYASCSIRTSLIVNKLTKVKPVGENVGSRFMPLTELPALNVPAASGRRHLPEDCTQKIPGQEVIEGGNVDIIGDYYDDHIAKTVATVIFPDHIDHNHFDVTTQVPYFTVGTIEAIGYHPSTIKSEHPSECEKIYQDHIDDQYSEESNDYSEESLEMARMPLFLKEYDVPDKPLTMEIYDDDRK